MRGADEGEGSLFERVDEGLVLPTELARGPWNPGALHGGPVAAVIAQAVEEVIDDGVDWFVARLTVDIERPVPLEPLAIDTIVTRPGRKVSIVDATVTLAATGMVLARARALRIRSANIAMPYEDPLVGPMLQREPAPEGPEHGTHHDIASGLDYVAFHADAVEHRYLTLPEPAGGEVFDWIRMTVPVLPDRPLTPLQRVAGVADFANGISHVLPFDTHLFINADLTIHMFQPMKGEWVGMASRSHHGPHGVGMSDTALFDTDGRIGRSEQSLLLELR
ncbi:MAG TPA: thioesterase family protein [Ilumatobacteraceae bacterium]|nr:thioesterase family protein [Ilumatobacteraceae bacterium]